MGDVGGLYVPEATAIAMRDQLLPLASLATPNRFELSWLCGAPLETNAAILEAALSLGPSRMLVTSAMPMMNGSTGNLYLSGNHALLAEHRLIDNPPNGPGDLLAALFVARLLDGLNEERALQLATASVFEIIARTGKRGADELTLERDASSLVDADGDGADAPPDASGETAEEIAVGVSGAFCSAIVAIGGAAL